MYLYQLSHFYSLNFSRSNQPWPNSSRTHLRLKKHQTVGATSYFDPPCHGLGYSAFKNVCPAAKIGSFFEVFEWHFRPKHRFLTLTTNFERTVPRNNSESTFTTWNLTERESRIQTRINSKRFLKLSCFHPSKQAIRGHIDQMLWFDDGQLYRVIAEYIYPIIFDGIDKTSEQLCQAVIELKRKLKFLDDVQKNYFEKWKWFFL